MKPIALLFALLSCTSALNASAPSSVSEMVYSEFTQITGVGFRSEGSRVLLLNSNGRYSGLFTSSTRLTTPTTSSSSIPTNGHWSYRKTGDSEAQLTLDGADYPLTFSSSFAGSRPSPDLFFTRITFSLKPYDSSAQLANCSNRSFVRAGGSAYAGFVLTGERRVLIRAIGPSLHSFGITDTLRTPVLKIMRAPTGETLGTNAGWSAPALAIVNQRAGAFPLPENSADSALFLSLTSGAYVADVSSADPTDSGQVMIEIYILP